MLVDRSKSATMALLVLLGWAICMDLDMFPTRLEQAMQLKQGSQPQDKKTTLVQYMELIIKIQSTVPLTSNMGQVVVVQML